MPDHTLSDTDGLIHALHHRRRLFEDAVVRVQTQKEHAEATHTSHTREVDRLTSRHGLLDKVGHVLRALLDALVGSSVANVGDVVTEGLRAIFTDYNLALAATVGTKYNKVTVDFSFVQTREAGDTIHGDPLGGFGGGPTSVASLLLRVVTLLRLGKAPFLLLDETLAAVSDGYVEGAGLFLQKMAQEVGVDVLVITHKQALADCATVAYQGSVTEQGALRLLRG